MGDIEFTSSHSIVIILESGPVIVNAKDIVSCYFIEDIYNYCMSGKLVFHDMYGLVEYGPLTGNEQIVIVYGKSDERQLIFDIWKVGKVSQVGVVDPTAETLLEIYFVDVMYELFSLKRYSRSFGGEWKISDIISHILVEMVGLDSKYLELEESKSVTEDFVMPYWTPMQAISWLGSRGRGGESGVGGYICYTSTSEGLRVNFKTLNWLLGDKNYLDDDLYVFEDYENRKNKILEWWMSGLDKGSTKVLRGGTWSGFNSNVKAPVSLEYKYSDGVADTIMMGRKSLYSDISDVSSKIVMVGESELEVLENIAYSDWCKRYNIQQIVNIIVRGHEDRYCGSQIEIVWPSTEKSEQDNKLMKGKYLVKSITHSLIGGGNNIAYQQRMVLIKNAYSDADMTSLVSSTKRNIY